MPKWLSGFLFDIPPLLALQRHELSFHQLVECHIWPPSSSFAVTARALHLGFSPNTNRSPRWSLQIHTGVSKNSAIPKWMVYKKWNTPIKMDDLGGKKTSIFGNTHMYYILITLKNSPSRPKEHSMAPFFTEKIHDIFRDVIYFIKNSS